MNKLKLKVWLTVVAIFIAGFAIGILATNLYYTSVRSTYGPGPHSHPKEMYLKQLQEQLNLTPEQAAEIRKISDETTQEFKQLRESIRPRIERVKDNSRARIRALLNADQQKKFDELNKEIEAKFKRNNRKDK